VGEAEPEMSRAWLLLAGLSIAGCDDQPLGGRDDAGAGGAQSSAPDGAPELDSAAPIRTVLRRNPFGNTAVADNLMVDGDFEWSGGSGQQGWRAFSQVGEARLSRGFGGHCRSGVSCAAASYGLNLLGMAAAPAGKKMRISIWSKPPDAICASSGVLVISCTTGAVFGLASLQPTSDGAGADGWCEHLGIAPEMSEQPCLYVTAHVEPEQRVLIDDAVLVAAGDGERISIAPTAPSAELAAQIDRDVRRVQELRRFGRPPPRREP
jgi:hypothetical protein